MDTARSVISLAKLTSTQLLGRSRSAVKKMKSVGANVEPCGTPLSRGNVGPATVLQSYC